MEPVFREWLAEMKTESGIRLFTDTSILSYCHALRRTCYKIEPYVAGNLFLIDSSSEFDVIHDKIINSFDFEQVDKESGNGTFSTSLKLYHFFLARNVAGAKEFAAELQGESSPYVVTYETQSSSPAEELSKPSHSSKSPKPATEETEEEATTEKPVRVYQSRKRAKHPEPPKEEVPAPEPEPEPEVYVPYVEVPMNPIQKIYFGAPGTGKSYSVSAMLEKAYPKEEQRESHCARITFHPAYTHQEFVGSLKPLSNSDKPLDYVFEPGPISVLLKEAFLHPREPYYFIIEEINRGNAPAIFGDLFQLLDRQDEGRSIYTITNNDLVSYFSTDLGLKNLFENGKIWFPPNFNILATMNISDESVFTLDAAFKRKFSMEYVPIAFDNVPGYWGEAYDIFKGKETLVDLFANTPLGSYVEELDREGKLTRNWPTFARLANKLIDHVNKQDSLAGGLRLTHISDNKKLGVFFVNRQDLIRREAFINKVVFYLKHDVFNDSDRYFTDSFDTIFEKYRKDGQDIFELLR